MKTIIISSPTDFQKENEIIQILFENGLECFHLRKKEKSKDELEVFLKGISSKYYKRIVVHDHVGLIGKYNLKGIHLSEKFRKELDLKDILKVIKNRNLSVSTSLHSIESVSECKQFDYVFLSPVFDSISKTDYKSNINLDEFRDFRSHNRIKSLVIGLGGIDKDNVEVLMQSGFDGIALLGAIWNNPDDALVNYLKIKSRISELTNA